MGNDEARKATTAIADALLLHKVAATLERCGVQHPQGHAALTRLAHAARAHALDFEEGEVEPAPEAGSKVASVYIGCAHFLLELPLLATAAFFGEPTLQHMSETAPAWAHATTEELQRSMARMLARACRTPRHPPRKIPSRHFADTVCRRTERWTLAAAAWPA